MLSQQRYQTLSQNGKSNSMEHIVAGCKDCPLFDSTGSEYGLYCHHPERPAKILEYNGIPGISGWPEASIYKEEKEAITKQYRVDGQTHIVRVKGPSISYNPGDFVITEYEIEDDKDYNPVTPDWCPLNKEPIIIIKENNG